MAASAPEPNSRQEHLWRVIFLSDKRAGQVFDIVLLVLIAMSVLTIMLESVESLRTAYRNSDGEPAGWGNQAAVAASAAGRITNPARDAAINAAPPWIDLPDQVA